MAVSCITTQLIVYTPVDGLSSVSKSGIKSEWRIQSLGYGSWLINRVLGSGVCIYTYPGGTPSVSELWVLSQSPGGAGGVLGLSGTGHGGGAPWPLPLQCVCRFFAVALCKRRQPSVWLSQTIARCLVIAAFTLLCPGKTTPLFISCQTSAWGFTIRGWVSSIVACENPSVAILTIFKARRMSDGSSCTRPPCLAKVADMWKPYKKLVAASKLSFGYELNHIRLCSVLEDVWSLLCPFLGTIITKLNCENPCTCNIVMINFAHCSDKCLGWLWRFPVMGSD